MISRKRLFAVALAHTPVDVRVIRIRKGLNGCAEPHLHRLQVPRPDSSVALQIFLHECAHYLLHHSDHKVRYLKEYEVEAWAIARMREAGIPVSHEATRRARRNVAIHVSRAMRSGMKIDFRAARFAWGRYARAWLRQINEAVKRGDSDIYFWCPERMAVTAGPPADWPISAARSRVVKRKNKYPLGTRLEVEVEIIGPNRTTETFAHPLTGEPISLVLRSRDYRYYYRSRGKTLFAPDDDYHYPKEKPPLLAKGDRVIVARVFCEGDPMKHYCWHWEWEEIPPTATPICMAGG
jgi:hypothetical protein